MVPVRARMSPRGTAERLCRGGAPVLRAICPDGTAANCGSAHGSHAFVRNAIFRLSQPASGVGHVGFYMGETETQVLTLGGNESDAVRQQFEPKARLFGYWWPKSVPLPEGGVIKVKSVDGHPEGSET
jgi:hypothetical protein